MNAEFLHNVHGKGGEVNFLLTFKWDSNGAGYIFEGRAQRCGSTGCRPITDAELFELADAVVWIWHPGEQGGKALADILFGDVNPSGRLPITFPRSLDDLPAYDDYGMAGRTYRYMEAEPLFPFGFGLAYTQYRSTKPKLDGVVEITVRLLPALSLQQEDLGSVLHHV